MEDVIRQRERKLERVLTLLYEDGGGDDDDDTYGAQRQDPSRQPYKTHRFV